MSLIDGREKSPSGSVPWKAIKERVGPYTSSFFNLGGFPGICLDERLVIIGFV